MPSSPKVLLVDRSAEEAEALGMPLRVAGYQLTVAQAARDAELALAHPVPPRLLVIDEALPEISAPELVARVHQRIATLPVIVLADAEYDTRYRSADSFLRKPVVPDELTRRALHLLPLPSPDPVTVVYQPDGNGWWTATCSSIPAASGRGGSIDLARRNFRASLVKVLGLAAAERIVLFEDIRAPKKGGSWQSF